MLPQWIIEKKRDGQSLDPDEIRFLIEGYSRDEIPDYQMAAFAMAVYFQGMDADETAQLTEAMMRSGDVLDLSALERPTADKHSTGGIGDKVSLILAPWAAACGLAVPMISGRGLGITGGTLDKMESIPGYHSDLDSDAFLEVLQACGCSIIGQTARLAPADKKFYALRDVTATVPAIPLIVASILSKKLAEGARALVFDVKCGEGAFMETPERAGELARALTRAASRMGRACSALVTDMSQPLGRACGNRLEVAEAVECLQGRGPDDLMEVTRALTARMLTLTERACDDKEAGKLLDQALESGTAWETFLEMVRLHGGDTASLKNPGQDLVARHIEDHPAPCSGFVRRVRANPLGRAAIVLGAGRRRTSDPVDPAVGIDAILAAGEPVEKGQPLARIHANDPARLEEARTLLRDAFEIGDQPPGPRSLILEEIQTDAIGSR